MNQWEGKAYSEGIPDDLPKKLLFSGRAPSYKAIAMCILRNDLYLTKLGLSPPKTKKGDDLIASLKESLKKSDQLNLF